MQKLNDWGETCKKKKQKFARRAYSTKSFLWSKGNANQFARAKTLQMLFVLFYIAVVRNAICTNSFNINSILFMFAFPSNFKNILR